MPLVILQYLYSFKIKGDSKKKIGIDPAELTPWS
jgi:hypothetical protein